MAAGRRQPGRLTPSRTARAPLAHQAERRRDLLARIAESHPKDAADASRYVSATSYRSVHACYDEVSYGHSTSVFAGAAAL